MRKILSVLTLAISMLIPSVVITKAQGLEPVEAWFVVVGVSNSDVMKGRSDTDKIWKNAKRCGFDTFADFSMKFHGFKPDFMLHVLDDFYTSKPAAMKALNQVKKCIPDAYVKKSVWAGE